MSCASQEARVTSREPPGASGRGGLAGPTCGPVRGATPSVDLVSRVKRVLLQQRLAPSPRAVEAENARAYGERAWLAAYARPESLALGLHESEEQVCERSLRPGDRILDVGCGTGREARGFARRGLRVTGIDVCPEA